MPPVIWLKVAHHRYSGSRKIFCFPLNFGFEDIDVFSEREVGSIVSSSVQLGDGAGHVVERAAEIVDHLTGDDGEFGGVLVRENKSPNTLCAVKIQITDHLITVRANEAAHRLIEVVDLGFGPMDLGIDNREWVRANVQ